MNAGPKAMGTLDALVISQNPVQPHSAHELLDLQHWCESTEGARLNLDLLFNNVLSTNDSELTQVFKNFCWDKVIAVKVRCCPLSSYYSVGSALIEGLKRSSRLRELSFNYCEPGIICFISLAEAILNLKLLDSFTLESNRTSVENYQQIIGALAGADNLSKFRLEGGDVLVNEMLDDIIKIGGNLKELDLFGVRYTGVVRLIEGLPSLERFYGFDDDLTDAEIEGIHALVDGMDCSRLKL